LFWIPLIVVALSAVLGYRFLPESTVREAGHIDWLSAVLLGGWLVAFLLGVSEAPTWGWLSAPVLGLIALGLVLAVAWIGNERRADNPVIDMDMMRIPILWRVNVVGLLYGAAIYSNFAFLPEFAQTPRSTGYGFGASITHSGLIMLPAPVLSFLFGNLASPLGRRIGAKWVVVLGSGLMIPSYGALLLPGHHETYLYIASGCLGAGYGLGFTIISNIILGAVPRAQSGVANGMHANIRTIGGAIFAAIVSSLITAHLQADGYPRSVDYTIGWSLLAVTAVVSTAVSLALPSIRLGTPRVVEPALAEQVA
jgi:hypothetical protein